MQLRRRFVDDEPTIERAAIDALAGAGGDHEWWCCPRLVGHLRVPLTPAEVEHVPAGLVTTDAGDTGPRRPRTK